VGDSRRGRRVGCVSDLRLLELVRFRLDELRGSEDSDGPFVVASFAVPPEIGCSFVDDRVLTRSLFLGDVLFLRPQTESKFLRKRSK
jgi:hypothetical protein